MVTTSKPKVWRGPKGLASHLVPIGSLSQHPDNPKDHDLGAIAASLARFGQQQPVLVQKSTGWIVAGNGRWEAVPMVAEMERVLDVGPGEAWTHIAAIFTEMTDLEAKAYALADNRSHDLGGYREDVLARVLTELSVTGDLLATGYDADDLDNLVASLRPSIPFDLGRQKEPDLGSEVVVEVRCSRAFLDTIRETLEGWGTEDGVSVAIA